MLEHVRNALRLVVYAVQRFLWVGILGRLLRPHRFWRLIEVTGIIAFVGPNGSGKSLAMVASVLPTLYNGVPWECDELAHYHNELARRHWDDCEYCDRAPRGRAGLCPVALSILDETGRGERMVYSTVPLRNRDGSLAQRYRPLKDFRQLVTIEHADVLFDEVAGVSDSSDSAGVPIQVTNWLHQLRKRDIRLRVTTPAYARCSKPIRQVVQVVVDARAYFPELNNTGRLWRSRQGMIYRAYDAFEFADYTPSTKTRLKPLASATFWRPGSAAMHAYDTLGAVIALGHTTDGGMCAICGGSRSRPRCGCSPELDSVPLDRLEVEERVSAAGARTRTGRLVETGDLPVSVPAGVGSDRTSSGEAAALMAGVFAAGVDGGCSGH